MILMDSFKGTLSSIEACELISTAIRKERRDINILSYLFGDGGENTLECFKKVLKDAQSVHTMVSSPYRIKEDAEYLIQNNTAIIESAKVIGLDKIDKRNPYLTSTYGLGQLIEDALDKGCRSFLVTLGGSSTNDGGAGMLSALGAEFIKKDGNEFISTGGTLNEIDNISISQLDARLKDCKFTLFSDVNNPLLGESGATFVFSRQKGASDKDIPILEENMRHYRDMVSKATGKDLSSMPGTGAAGGLAYGFSSFFDCTIKSGAKEILSLYGIEEKLNDVDLLITGEGRTDSSSLDGKCISILSSMAKKHKIRVLLVSGSIEKKILPKLKDIGITDYLSIQKDETKTFEEIKLHAKEDLLHSMIEYIREGRLDVLLS